MIHNDTLNIWSHLLTMIFAIYKMATLENEQKIIQFLGLFGVSFCMLFSSMFHIFRDQGPKESLFFLKLDLIGIVIMIFFMGVCSIWIGFSDHPGDRLRIMVAICSIFGINFIFSLTPCYTNHRYEKLRVGFNVLTILSLLSIGFIWTLMFATTEEIDMFFVDLMISFSYLIIGFIFYRTRFPEAFLT